MRPDAKWPRTKTRIATRSVGPTISATIRRRNLHVTTALKSRTLNPEPTHVLKPGQKIGKYKLKSRLSNGPYATVFRALDTLEGVHVALKIPHKGLVTKESLDDFSREVRLAAKLDHPNILP